MPRGRTYYQYLNLHPSYRLASTEKFLRENSVTRVRPGAQTQSLVLGSTTNNRMITKAVIEYQTNNMLKFQKLLKNKKGLLTYPKCTHHHHVYIRHQYLYAHLQPLPHFHLLSLQGPVEYSH